MKTIFSIRGATVCQNTVEDITRRTVELIQRMLTANKLKDSQLINCMFSTTKEITAYYPAAAARKSGLLSCPLFSSLEPDMENGLQNCIRVLLTVKAKKENLQHIYLYEAASLRPDLGGK